MQLDFQSLSCFLLDMDGTIYLGGRLFPGVPEFLERLRATGRRFLFFTNNSSQDAAGYAEKLTRLGIAVEPGQVLTSGEATVTYLREVAGARRIYLLGTPSLEGEMRAAGLELDDREPEAVVLGFDLTLTYDKLRRACHFIRAGVPFVASHPDLTCPTEAGPVPDCGAITALLTAATGVEPVVVGKPNHHMAGAALGRLGAAPSQTAIVGDRLYTDMEMGFRSGLKTILVLSGETSAEMVGHAERKPDLVLPSVAELTDLLT